VTPVTVTEGAGPLVLGLPHVGTWVPADVGAALNAEGRKLRDTDWHIDSLYDGLAGDVTVVRANFHRYVIDANRDPAGVSLYPGQNTTGLVPETDFDGAPIWDAPVTGTDVAARRAAFHAPYHAALTAQMERVRAAHGVAILYDCHSIRSRIPFLFDGVLPDFNLGTNGGTTCDPRLTAAVMARLAGTAHVLDGRFKGGWTTRHYGRPADGWHAIQMELAQSAYLEAEAAPWRMDGAKCAALRDRLSAILNDIIALAPELKVTP
jgi:N-formylglutamate deformylase